MKTLSLRLQSFTGARAGEIRRSHQYESLECLLWEHITIRPGTTANVCRAIIDLQHTKCIPGGTSEEAKQFSSRSRNRLCPIKLLLCHALRTEAVEENSWEELRQVSKERPRKQVLWTYIKRPVICALSNSSQEVLKLGEPSNTSSAILVFNEDAKCVGLLTNLIPHDIRRGTARELAHLRDSNVRVAVEQA
ncbi:hypothetical protein FPOAC2_01107 [Fusarium poae]|uniref:hypothetical protein n=1 Tax=Fusarium poae TaxID=36050 RepID=UPI001CEA7D78|nr:hypothetical protein FPOAC1_001041 [Fusarium poae]KAG8675064.1 hypothetical protein FPOAC1_001041 [Fusarium poae]